jgi:hypothetical protein
LVPGTGQLGASIDSGEECVQRWEYHVFDMNGRAEDAEAELDALGIEGWELMGAVAMATSAPATSTAGKSPQEQTIRYVMRRPRTQTE